MSAFAAALLGLIVAVVLFFIVLALLFGWLLYQVAKALSPWR